MYNEQEAREQLKTDLEGSAFWRHGKAVEYPDDARNQHAADLLSGWPGPWMKYPAPYFRRGGNFSKNPKTSKYGTHSCAKLDSEVSPVRLLSLCRSLLRTGVGLDSGAPQLSRPRRSRKGATVSCTPLRARGFQHGGGEHVSTETGPSLRHIQTPLCVSP